MARSHAAEFRERAEELRSIAALVHDKHNREIILKCAGGYEKMADQYEKTSVQSGKFKHPLEGIRHANSQSKAKAEPGA